MKYQDVITMKGAGILGATSHSLSLNAAYSLTKFKVEVDRINREWVDRNAVIAKECGIDDTDEFDKRRKVLQDKQKDNNINQAEAKELKEMNTKFERVMGMRNKLNDDDVTITCKPMAYADWHALKEENKNLQTNGFELLSLVEPQLEDILWKAPEE